MISQETARLLLDYSPESGEIRWKARDRSMFNNDGSHSYWNECVAGNIASFKNETGRSYITVLTKSYPLSRLIWIYVNGDIPDGFMVDHVDGDHCNDHPSNLRLATRGQNGANKRLRTKSKSGFKGVSARADGRWLARIGHEGRDKHLGLYKTPEEAAHAYNKAAIRLHGEFAVLNPMGGVYVE